MIESLPSELAEETNILDVPSFNSTTEATIMHMSMDQQKSETSHITNIRMHVADN